MAQQVSNPFRARGTVTVRITGPLSVAGLGAGESLEVTYPFPSMLLPEALEWQKRSGLAQANFWQSVGKMEPVGIQCLLWQALRRQEGDMPAGHPWTSLKWDDIDWDEVDLYAVAPSFGGGAEELVDDEQEEGSGDPDLPTTSAGEGSGSG